MAFALATTTFADRLHLANGITLEVEEAWEQADGIWYKRDGVTQFISRERVKRIERVEQRGTVVPAKVVQVKEDVALTAALSPAAAPSQPVWVYLIGGARMQVDEAVESAEGIWCKRANITLFLDKERVERIEREPMVAKDSSPLHGSRNYKWSTGSSKLDLLIRESGTRHGIDPYLIFCVMEQESHFNQRAVSPVGARGLMQLMPGTARRFGVRNAHDPAQSIDGGTRYLKELMGMFGGRVDLVLASYNAGEGAVMRYGQRVPPYAETRNYVKRISKRYQQAEVPVPSADPNGAPARAAGLSPR